MHADIAVLPGDGIGPEVTAAAVTVLRTLARRHGHSFDFHEYDIGGVAIDRHGEPLVGHAALNVHPAQQLLNAVCYPFPLSRVVNYDREAIVIFELCQFDCCVHLRLQRLGYAVCVLLILFQRATTADSEQAC